MPSTDLLDLIRDYDQDIAKAEVEAQAAIDRVHEAAKAATLARGRFETLRSERSVLAKIAEERGIAEHVAPLPEATIPPEDYEDDWRSMNRLDAVERILRESPGPMHINDIENSLRFHGRLDDNYQVISASLANLKSRRGTVVAVGQGRWEYVRAGTNASGHPPYTVSLRPPDDVIEIWSGGHHPENDPHVTY
jgi:hypothetical protein